MGAGKGQTRRIKTAITNAPQMLGFPAHRHRSGRAYFKSGDRAIWIGADDTDLNNGREIVVDKVIGLSASQGGGTVYNGHFSNNPEEDFVEATRENLYATGDAHVEAWFLSKVFLSNVEWKVKERCLFLEDGKITNYTPEFKTREEFDVFKAENYTKLIGKNVIIPGNIPYVNLWRAERQIKPLYPGAKNSIKVEEVLIGHKCSSSFGHDPMVVWTEGNRKIAIPADMVFLQSLADNREPLLTQVDSVDGLVF